MGILYYSSRSGTKYKVVGANVFTLVSNKWVPEFKAVEQLVIDGAFEIDGFRDIYPTSAEEVTTKMVDEV